MDVCNILLGDHGEEFIESIGYNTTNILTRTDAIYLHWKGISEEWIEKLHSSREYIKYNTCMMCRNDLIRYLKEDPRLIPIHKELVDVGNMLHGNYDSITTLNNIILYITDELEESFDNLIKNRPDLSIYKTYRNYHHPIFIKAYCKYVEGYLTVDTIPNLIKSDKNIAEKLHTRLYEIGYDTLKCPILELKSIDDVLYYLRVCPNRFGDISNKFSKLSAILSDNAEILDIYYKNGLITEQDIIDMQIFHLRHYIKRSLSIPYYHGRTELFAREYDIVIIRQGDEYSLFNLKHIKDIRYSTEIIPSITYSILERFPNVSLYYTSHLKNISSFIEEFYKNVTLFTKILNSMSFTNLIEIANSNSNILKYHHDLSIISKYCNIAIYAKKIKPSAKFNDCTIICYH